MTIPIHLVSPPLSEQRAKLAIETMRVVMGGISPGPALVVAPAGLACVEDDHAALELAEALRELARRAGVALVFGVDVGPPKPDSGRIFACYGGAAVLWPAHTSRGFPVDAERRLLLFGNESFMPLYAQEALDVSTPRRLATLEVSATLVLSHGGATQRWSGALARIERVSPVAVALHHGAMGRGYATRSLGVNWLAAQQVAEARVA